MGDEEDLPLEFANRVIKQFAEHLIGADDLKTQDYTVIRVGFRKLQGSWFSLCRGDVTQMDTLSRVVKAWGKLREKR